MTGPCGSGALPGPHGEPTAMVILVPVLRRPHRVAPLLDSISAATPAPYRVLFIADPDDHEEHDAVRETGGELLIVDGNYARKINAGVESTSERLLFLGADDLHFHPGWLDAAQARLTRRIGVVGTNDLGNSRVIAGRHATHFLVSRPYTKLGTVDERGKLLHEGYHHNFVDNEFVSTAKHRHAWAHAGDAIVEHLHPHWGKSDNDATYVRGQSQFDRDRRLFQRRRPLWRYR